MASLSAGDRQTERKHLQHQLAGEKAAIGRGEDKRCVLPVNIGWIGRSLNGAADGEGQVRAKAVEPAADPQLPTRWANNGLLNDTANTEENMMRGNIQHWQGLGKIKRRACAGQPDTGLRPRCEPRRAIKDKRRRFIGLPNTP